MYRIVLHSLITWLWFFCFEIYGDLRDQHVLTHSFPTRRSSDLIGVVDQRDDPLGEALGIAGLAVIGPDRECAYAARRFGIIVDDRRAGRQRLRIEEVGAEEARFDCRDLDAERGQLACQRFREAFEDRKSTRLNSSH